MKQRLFVLNCLAAALVGLAHAAPAAAAEGYVTLGQDPDQPLHSRYGECVHSYSWREGLRFSDCEPKPVEPIAAEPAPAPEPTPIVEAPKPAPEPEPVVQNVPFRLSTDTFFDFDKTTLRVEGRSALDELAQRLAVTHYDTITIVGHADRIGARTYNQALSEKRAQAMRDYLVANGVDAQKISASGVGEDESNAPCAKLRGAKLIACLQPDRFAEVTANGTATVSQR